MSVGQLIGLRAHRSGTPWNTPDHRSPPPAFPATTATGAVSAKRGALTGGSSRSGHAALGNESQPTRAAGENAAAAQLAPQVMDVHFTALFQWRASQLYKRSQSASATAHGPRAPPATHRSTENSRGDIKPPIRPRQPNGAGGGSASIAAMAGWWLPGQPRGAVAHAAGHPEAACRCSKGFGHEAVRSARVQPAMRCCTWSRAVNDEHRCSWLRHGARRRSTAAGAPDRKRCNENAAGFGVWQTQVQQHEQCQPPRCAKSLPGIWPHRHHYPHGITALLQRGALGRRRCPHRLSITKIRAWLDCSPRCSKSASASIKTGSGAASLPSQACSNPLSGAQRQSISATPHPWRSPLFLPASGGLGMQEGRTCLGVNAFGTLAFARALVLCK